LTGDAVTEIAGAHSEEGNMDVDAASKFRNKGISTSTENEQHPQVGKTLTCTFNYSEHMGIVIQMLETTAALAASTHEQNEKLLNKISEMTWKLKEVKQVIEGSRLQLTYNTEGREVQVDSKTQKLEHVDVGEIETAKELTPDIQHTANTSVGNENLETSISGEKGTLTRFIGSRGNNISGENKTKSSTAHNTLSWPIDRLDNINSGEKGVVRGVAQLEKFNSEDPANSGEPATYWAPQANFLADEKVTELPPQNDLAPNIDEPMVPQHGTIQRNSQQNNISGDTKKSKHCCACRYGLESHVRSENANNLLHNLCVRTLAAATLECSLGRSQRSHRLHCSRTSRLIERYNVLLFNHGDSDNGPEFMHATSSLERNVSDM